MAKKKLTSKVASGTSQAKPQFDTIDDHMGHNMVKIRTTIIYRCMHDECNQALIKVGN